MGSIFRAALLVSLVYGQSAAEETTLESAPPVVVKTTPVAGTSDVDPTTTEIQVTFSKEMQDGSWSWCNTGDDSFPETTGKPKYQNGQRMCVLPVKLRSGKTYAIWLNTEKFQNFKDTQGRAAVPYLLVFKTKE